MYNMYPSYGCPYYVNTVMQPADNTNNMYQMFPYPYCHNAIWFHPDFLKQFANYFNPSNDIEHDDVYTITLKDYGPEPFVINIEKATKQNNTFRTALWTGCHLQITLMSIKPGEEIGLEIHPNLDQFIRIEEGEGIVKMGNTKDKLDFQKKVYDDFAIVIPAGKWHNLINTGYKPLKLYSIYAPPQHPHGTVHKTKADAEAAEQNHSH